MTRLAGDSKAPLISMGKYISLKGKYDLSERGKDNEAAEGGVEERTKGTEGKEVLLSRIVISFFNNEI